MFKRGTNQFKDEWLKDAHFNTWLEKDTSVTKAKCKLCCKTFDIGNMGIADLESHAKGDKYKMKLSSSGTVYIQQFYKATNQSGDKGTLKSFVISSAVMATKIKWALKIEMSHFSFRSCLDISELFCSMFSDNHIAKSFKLSKTKCVYLINFSIASYFKEVLRKEIINANVFSLLFDESMNYILQNEQLDIHVRFWDDSKCMAVTQYFDSHFLRELNADNIVTKLQQGLQKLVSEKMIQLSMDGPATNWSVFENMSD